MRLESSKVVPDEEKLEEEKSEKERLGYDCYQDGDADLTCEKGTKKEVVDLADN